jgi:hypothetical protein
LALVMLALVISLHESEVVKVRGRLGPSDERRSPLGPGSSALAADLRASEPAREIDAASGSGVSL